MRVHGCIVVDMSFWSGSIGLLSDRLPICRNGALRRCLPLFDSTVFPGALCGFSMVVAILSPSLISRTDFLLRTFLDKVHERMKPKSYMRLKTHAVEKRRRCSTPCVFSLSCRTIRGRTNYNGQSIRGLGQVMGRRSASNGDKNWDSNIRCCKCDDRNSTVNSPAASEFDWRRILLSGNHPR